VFERFYRIEGGKASGSGLGLSIARELARLMHGSVRLESAPGRTVVTLEVPADGNDERDAAAFSRENGSGSSPPPD
jgi:two-component system sensor histidine kinase TctE